MISIDTIYDFEKIINQKVTDILDEYTNWFDNDYPLYIQFYKSQIDNIPLMSIQKYIKLLNEISFLQENIRLNLNRLQRSDFCTFIENIDTIYHALLSVKVLSKLLKSSKINEYDTGNISINIPVKASSTPEMIHSDMGNPQNDWVNTYIKNRIYELQYDEGNGYILSKELQQFQTFDVNTVLDNLSGEKLNGKDIDCNFSFNSNKSDLIVLDYNATVNQTFNIALNYKRGDHPYYINVGIDTELVFGNLIMANLQFIISDLNKTIALDDVLQDVSIKSINVQDNNLLLTVTGTSIANTQLTQTVKI